MINAYSVLMNNHHIYVQGAKTHYTTLGPQIAHVFTMLSNMEAYGFTLSENAIYQLSHQSKKSLANIWKDTQRGMIYMTGGHQLYKPMYPNFPEQVMSASDCELYTNALMHYLGDWIGIRILPSYQEKKRPAFIEKIKPKMVGIAFDQDLEMFFKQLTMANTSISATQTQYLSDLYQHLVQKPHFKDLITSIEIPQKEILANIAAEAMHHQHLDWVSQKLDTPTDVLRLVAVLCHGDVSLAKPFRVGKLTRSERRQIASLIQDVFARKLHNKEQFIENMFSYREQWVHVAHALHIGEYRDKYPLAFEVFSDLRENKEPQTFNSKVKALMNAGDIQSASELLYQRPGVFARSLNELIRKAQPNDVDYVIALFAKAVDKVSTTVLIQAHSYFKNDTEQDVRVFMPKGGLGKVFTKEQPVQPLGAVAERMTRLIEDALVKRFSTLAPLGKVYIDPALEKQNVPFAQRSASKALRSVSRGSRFEMDSTKDIVRLFLWWNESFKDTDGSIKQIGRIDIDLSCVMMNEDFSVVDSCTYYHLRTKGVTHSGDITSAPNGACEFIDVDLKKINDNVRFILMSVNAFTNHLYKDVPECYAGWMERSHQMKGELFDPRTVQNKVDLTSESMAVIPAVFDVKSREFIWCDLSVPTGVINNVGANSRVLSHAVEGIVKMVKPNLYDLFAMHAKARGTIVDRKEEADVIFSLYEGITPFHFGEITGEFMADPPSDEMRTNTPSV